MKFLAALALLILAVAEANHVPEHTLRGPRYKVGRQYKYDVELNMTAGVLGLNTQVSAAVLQADVSIYAKTEREHILKIENVLTSGSVKAIDNKYGDIPLRANRELEDKLASPIKFILENGKVVSYTLSEKDNLESRKIKKSILRSLEMYVPDSALEELESPPNAPVTYNTTETTDYGVHSSHYMITVSPDVDFPSDETVYNISRIDNFEAEMYPGHKLYHNFQKQGCPEVCRNDRTDWNENRYEAGCPNGHEPHQSPIKTSFSHEHSLSAFENVLSPEIITTVEVHYAKMYDQDMEVLIRYQLTRKEVTTDAIVEPPRQTSYTDLKEMESEINEKEISDLCSYKKTDEAVVAADELLNEISKIIVKGDLDNEESLRIGEKSVLLRDVLSRLLEADFKTVEAKIKSVDNLKFAQDFEKVKRQIWMDILPLVGTDESVKYIVEYITRQVRGRDMMVWEAKEILESLPQNIERPDSDTIRELLKLTKNTELLRKSPLLHSAIHISMARVVGEVCGNVPVVRSPQKQQSSWFGKLQAAPEKINTPVPCPEQLVSQIVTQITEKLRGTRVPAEIAVYLETLSHIGTYDVLPVISEYVYGTAENIQELGPRFIDFTKSMAQFALHNIAGKYPEEVLDMVMPVFFNETETPKVRNAAFGVLIRCQPSLETLQKVVIRSWYERSYEVGSFVTSTMESFGNSSLPCMQLTSHRIKVVLPQMRRFDVGMHHAKNNIWTYFDDNREFGLEGRFEYTPNNESFIPSTMYKSLSYSMDSLRDIIFQSSHNVEGLTQEKILEKITEYLNIEDMETIEKEEEVFGRGRNGASLIQPRIVDDLRLTTYSKIFYKSSYYYLDFSSMRSVWQDISTYLNAYLKKTETKYTGYLVKLMIPSSFHSVAIAKTIPYPVEFEMRQPVIVALNIKTSDNTPMKPSLKHFDMHIRPSVYLTKLYSHQIKNIGDCKEVGVYHEHKMAMTYPFEIKYDGMTFPNVTIKYKVPPKSKTVLNYNTGAGTYAAKKELKTLPLTTGREEIRTIPKPFKFDRNVNLVGVPPLHVELKTEDMNILSAKLPRNPIEALHLAVKRILNAGWRRKSVKIAVLEDETLWTGDTEATFKIEYSRKHVPRYARSSSPRDLEDEDSFSSEYHGDSQLHRQPSSSHHSQMYNPHILQSGDKDEDWSRYLKPVDREDVSSFTENARTVSRILNYMLPHISHVWNVSVTAEPLHSTAYLRMEFNHTYEKNLFSVHTEAASKRSERQRTYQVVTLDHLMGFWNMPDEFKYDTHYGSQQAGFLTAINLNQGRAICAWDKVEIAMRGFMHYESNKKILEKELTGRIDEKYFLPETHEQCMRDVRDGKSMSVDCVKAIREYSIFNKMNMDIMWDEELPQPLRRIARKADIYMKHHFFEHMDMTEERNTPKRMNIKVDYIDKLVDEPVVDIEITKPKETVTLRRIPIGRVQPLSSVYNIHETAILEATNNTYMPTCMMMEKYINTYDLKTFEFQPRDCHYVLSTHCTKRKNFAVVVRGTKEIYVHIGTNTIVLAPKSGEDYKIKYNDQERVITDPMLLHERDEIYVYPETYDRNHRHIKVVGKKAGISVVYDGKNVKVQVSPRYKGEMCGLCSEFDGEELREFRGLDRCLYKDYMDFANSNMVKREGSCKVERLRESKICDSESNRFSGDESTRGNGPSMQRNAVITKGDEVCFSVQPVPVCSNNAQPMKTEYQSVSFHCLPKRDITARKMINEAKWRPLEEVERKSVDLVEKIPVAKMC